MSRAQYHSDAFFGFKEVSFSSPPLILIAFNRNVNGRLGAWLTDAIVARDQDIARAFPADEGIDESTYL